MFCLLLFSVVVEVLGVARVPLVVVAVVLVFCLAFQAPQRPLVSRCTRLAKFCIFGLCSYEFTFFGAPFICFETFAEC